MALIMLVKLLKAKRINVNGHPTDFYPGDWPPDDAVGRQAALQWEAEGACYIPKIERKSLIGADKGVGILVTHNDVASVRGKFADMPNLKIEAGEPALPWAQTILWDGLSSLRNELIPIGLGLLNTWEVIAPLVNYEHLALHEGAVKDKDGKYIKGDDWGLTLTPEGWATAAVVRDLRVLLYDPRLVFVRDCEAGRRFCATWKQEGWGRLALLRTVYRVKPLILALPVTWMGG